MITCLLLPGCFFLETSWQGNTGFFTMEVIPVVRKDLPIQSPVKPISFFIMKVMWKTQLNAVGRLQLIPTCLLGRGLMEYLPGI